MDEQAELTTVYAGASRSACREAELVLRALGIEHGFVESPGGARLVVAPRDAPRARREIAAYFAENAHPGGDEPAWPHARPWPGVALWAIVLLAVHAVHVRGAGGLDWEASGRSIAGLVRDGEWWRAVTALTLHTDLRHLFGNVFFGALFVGPVCQVLGTGLGLWMVLVVGSAGNALNALIQPDAHGSVGASTAVFGALGLLAAFQWRRRLRLGSGALRRWTPVIVGVILLGYLGTSGARTDVLAHVTGFLAGLLCGAALGPLEAPPADRRAQAAFGALALLVLAFAWGSALNRG